MAWSWSHTQEAYYNAKRQMEALDRDTRNVIAAEWLATPKDKYGGYASTNFDLRKYHHSMARVAAWDDEYINEFIWGRMEEHATCSNGGWEAYCCPHGCGPHMVPFAPVWDEEELRSTFESDRPGHADLRLYTHAHKAVMKCRACVSVYRTDDGRDWYEVHPPTKEGRCRTATASGGITSRETLAGGSCPSGPTGPS